MNGNRAIKKSQASSSKLAKARRLLKATRGHAASKGKRG